MFDTVQTRINNKRGDFTIKLVTDSSGYVIHDIFAFCGDNVGRLVGSKCDTIIATIMQHYSERFNSSDRFSEGGGESINNPKNGYDEGSRA